MKTTAVRRSAIVVTPAAASVLQQLAAHFRQQLKFRVFAGGLDCPMLRIHDKDYPGDLLLSIGGVGIAVCPHTFYGDRPLHIDSVPLPRQPEAFELVLSVNKRATTILSLEKIVERLRSRNPYQHDLATAQRPAASARPL